MVFMLLSHTVVEKTEKRTCARRPTVAFITDAGAFLLSETTVCTLNPATHSRNTHTHSTGGTKKPDCPWIKLTHEPCSTSATCSCFKRSVVSFASFTLAEPSCEAGVTLALAGGDVQVAVLTAAHATGVHWNF